MPQLNKICVILNAGLKAGTLKSKRFQPGDYYGVTRFVSEKNDDGTLTRPCVIDNDGKCTPVVVNDSIQLQVYHRIRSLKYDEVPEDTFGEKKNCLQETASMVCVVAGDRNNLQLTPEDLVAGIAIDIKKQLTQADLVALQIKQGTIIIDDVEIDQEKVYVSEYGTPYSLKPNFIMASVNYRIITEYNPRCLDLCTV